MGPQLLERLVEHGLFSPARIVAAGLVALEAVPGLGEKKAAGILAAAEQWIEEHPPLEPEAEAPDLQAPELQAEDIVDAALPAADEAAPHAVEDEAPPESVARTSAE